MRLPRQTNPSNCCSRQARPAGGRHRCSTVARGLRRGQTVVRQPPGNRCPRPRTAAKGLAGIAVTGDSRQSVALERRYESFHRSIRMNGAAVPWFCSTAISNPCLPATEPVLRLQLPIAAFCRLQYCSTPGSGNSRFQRPDGVDQCGRTQLRIPLGHRQILMTDEFLSRSHRRASHYEVRAERITQDVHAGRHIRRCAS
jgi:hypothetical protein